MQGKAIYIWFGSIHQSTPHLLIWLYKPVSKGFINDDKVKVNSYVHPNLNFFGHSCGVKLCLVWFNSLKHISLVNLILKIHKPVSKGFIKGTKDKVDPYTLPLYIFGLVQFIKAHLSF